MPTVTLDPNVPPNTGESPGLGASRIRALTQALLDLLGLPAGVAISTPLTIARLGPFTNRSGATINPGDLVAFDAANDLSVVLDDTTGSAKSFVVTLAIVANGATGMFGGAGEASVHTFGAVTRGHYLRKSASTGGAVEDMGVAQSAGPPPAGALGLALTATASVGNSQVTALLWGFTTGATNTANLSPTATPAANRAALQAAHDALPAAGGMTQVTTYGNHIDAAINVTKPWKLVGPGTTELSTPGTFVLILDTASQVGFNVTAKGPFILQDVSISGATGTTHVKINGPTGALKGTESVTVTNCIFSGGDIQLDFRAAIFQRVRGCTFFNYTGAGCRVQNVLDGDQGDSTIDDCIFSSAPSANIYGILYASGGGLKIRGCKFLGNDAGIAVDPTTTATDPATISDLVISQCSIEGWNSRGIYLTRSSGSLAPANIQILGCEITQTTGAGTVGILIAPAAGTAYDRIVIDGNVIAAMATAIQLRGCTNGVITDNVLAPLTTFFDVASTVVNWVIEGNRWVSAAIVMAGTPGAGFILLEDSLQILFANLPAPATGSRLYCTDALGPGDGGWTAGMVAAGAGTGAFLFRKGANWRA